MKWSCLVSVTLIGCCAAAQDVPLLSAYSVGIGKSCDGIDIYRFGVRKDSSYRFFPSDTGWLSGYYEASLSDWRQGNEEVYVVSFSPVFVYTFGDAGKALLPYVEEGIGVAGISGTQIGGRDLSTGFQFEDRIGVGLRMNKVDLNVRYMHYSNGSVREPNEGLDLFILTLSWLF